MTDNMILHLQRHAISLWGLPRFVRPGVNAPDSHPPVHPASALCSREAHLSIPGLIPNRPSATRSI